MWETTSALTRVALLVLVTGTFAAVWSNDQQTQTAYVLARREAAYRAGDPALVEHSPTSDKTLSTAVEEESRTVVRQVTIEMRLPEEITPGRYRVVQPSGAMFTMTVSSFGTIAATPRDLYIVDLVDGGRQCFIRIDQQDATPTGMHATAARPQSARR